VRCGANAKIIKRACFIFRDGHYLSADFFDFAWIRVGLVRRR
jgi:hypothetical protein